MFYIGFFIYRPRLGGIGQALYEINGYKKNGFVSKRIAKQADRIPYMWYTGRPFWGIGFGLYRNYTLFDPRPIGIG